MPINPFYSINRKTILLILLFLKSFSILYAQNNPLNTTIIPPSPNASSLGKFGDFPVNEFTGVPEISIPIYEIQVKDNIVPINLLYHASGIKVDEIASWVGLGWSLSAGGQVTRSVRGLPDEMALKGFQNVGALFQNKIYPGDNSANYDLFKKIADGSRDGELDEYFYTLNNKSGKFVYGLDNNPILLKHDNIKIEQKFVITDEKGLKYYFSDTETSTPEVPGDLGIYSYISTWYLSRVEDHNGIILYEIDYENTYFNLEGGMSETLLYALSGRLQGTQHYFFNQSNVTLSGKRLKRIRFPNGKIEFEATHIRKDLNDNALTKIKIYDKDSLIKSFKLDYLYKNNRLYLNQIEEIATENISKVTKFNYKGEAPSKGTLAQDHWGYFNGRYSNTLIPNVTYNGIDYSGANREPDHNSTVLGTLESIIYPTKGATKFVYENNDYYIPPNSVASIVNASTGLRQRCSNTNRISIDTTNFTLEMTSKISLTTNYTYTNDICATSSASYKIISQDGTQYSLGPSDIYLPAGNYKFIGILECEQCSNFISSGVITYNKYQTTTTNGYNKVGPALRIKKIINYIDSLNTEASHIEYSYNDTLETNKSTGFLFSTPQYHYTYSETTYEVNEVNVSNPVTNNYLARSSNSMSSLGSVRGGLLGYRTITIKSTIPGGNNGGKVVFYYIDNSTATPKPKAYPFAPKPYLDINNGYKTKEIFFDSRNNILRKIDYEYEIFPSITDQNPKIWGLKVGYLKKSYTQGFNQEEFAYDYYLYNTTWLNLIKKITTDYNNNGATNIKTEDYEYKQGYTFPSIIKSSNSKNENIITKIYYPADFLNTAPYQTLVQRNALNKDVIKEHYLNNSLLSSIKTDYSFQNGAYIYPKTISQIDANNIVSNHINLSNYDNYGNPLEIKKQNLPSTVYLWGYSGQYPVAKIENATYDEVKTILTEPVINSLNSDMVTEATILNTIATLRDNPNMKKAQVWTYTYKPLVGMSCEVDPRGIKTQYTYDGFQRLKDILDFDNNIIQNHQYHYKP